MSDTEIRFDVTQQWRCLGAAHCKGAHNPKVYVQDTTRQDITGLFRLSVIRRWPAQARDCFIIAAAHLLSVTSLFIHVDADNVPAGYARDISSETRELVRSIPAHHISGSSTVKYGELEPPGLGKIYDRNRWARSPALWSQDDHVRKITSDVMDQSTIVRYAYTATAHNNRDEQLRIVLRSQQQLIRALVLFGLSACRT
ncbi:hypothetical protein J6590_001533 [Homalodisca vitripennis]|nr:hypothetical protein J6590_001533 [Homalodisca vitripennis]